jgi:hypothetical protein
VPVVSAIMAFECVAHEGKKDVPFEKHKGCGTPSHYLAGSYRNGILHMCEQIQDMPNNKAWPTRPVQVDGFPIGTISTRKWTSTPPNTVTVTWP